MPPAFFFEGGASAASLLPGVGVAAAAAFYSLAAIVERETDSVIRL